MYYMPEAERSIYRSAVMNVLTEMRGKYWYLLGSGRNNVGQAWQSVNYWEPTTSTWIARQIFNTP